MEKRDLLSLGAYCCRRCALTLVSSLSPSFFLASPPPAAAVLLFMAMLLIRLSSDWMADMAGGRAEQTEQTNISYGWRTG